jgi:hypothetical protein
MSPDKETLEQRQKLRYKILRTMFDETVEVSNDPTRQLFSPRSISSGLQLPVEETLTAMQYLAGEYLIEERAQVHGRYDSRYRISHQGIVEIERSIENPEVRTEHFMLNVVQHFNAPVGSVQNAPNSAAQVIQNNNMGASLSEVFSLIEEIQAEALLKLPSEKQQEAKDELQVLKNEVASEKNPKRLKTIWKGLQSGVLGTIDVATKLAVLAEKLKSLGFLDVSA